MALLPPTGLVLVGDLAGASPERAKWSAKLRTLARPPAGAGQHALKDVKWLCSRVPFRARYCCASVMRGEPLPWPSYACSAPPREIDLGAAGRLPVRPQLRRRFRQPPVQRCLIGDVLWSCAGSTRKAPRWDGVRRFTGESI
jgi:hypothetical protein